MAKQPTLPLYYNDISRTCSTWTDEEFGCYLRLLIEQWDKGYIPVDVNRLKRLSTSVETHWPLIKDKFTESNGVLQNLHMEEIREKLKKHSKNQKDNIAKRYAKGETETPETLPKHIQRETLKPYTPEKSEGTHTDFAKKIMSNECEEDRNAIGVTCKKSLTADVVKRFNAHCVNQTKTHPTFDKWKSHLASWYNLQKVEVKTPMKYKELE